MSRHTITVEQSWFESAFDVSFGSTQSVTLQRVGDEVMALYAATKSADAREKVPDLLLNLASRLLAGAEMAEKLEKWYEEHGGEE